MVVEDPALRGELGELLEQFPDLVALIDDSGRFRALNRAWEQTLGWSRQEVTGELAMRHLHPADVERTLALAQPVDGRALRGFENRWRCRDGGYRTIEWSACKRGDTWLAVGRDVTRVRRLERRALQDPLTGLPNRAALIDRLGLALTRLERKPGLVVVLFVDLDRFKVINDTMGHDVGDAVLEAAAARLRDVVRGADTVARIGGDEFVVVIDDDIAPAGLEHVAARVTSAFAAPFAIGGDELTVGASVGIAASDRPDDPTELLRRADIAMYRAKERGGGRSELFDGAMRAEAELRVRTEAELRNALDRGELLLHYQPIVALPETSVTRCEALLRWAHPQRGLLEPDAFVPLAEQSGMIVPVGAWVLREACRQAQAWRQAGGDVGVTVNVSTRQLGQQDLVEVVREALDAARLPAELLCLEITETAILRHPERVADTLHALKRLGVQVAVDDFGTGYSSLSYLRTLPLDIIKVDKAYVAGVRTSTQDRAIVAAIVSLARETGLSVIAEGVESEALHAEVVALGCDLGQGFVYDRPRPPGELRLDGYSSRIRPGVGDTLVVREFMRQIGIPARIEL